MIQCLELAGDQKVSNYARVKQNKYNERMQTILTAEAAWKTATGNPSFNENTTFLTANTTRAAFAAYLDKQVEDGKEGDADEAAKKIAAEAQKVIDAMAAIDFCSPT